MKGKTNRIERDTWIRNVTGWLWTKANRVGRDLCDNDWFETTAGVPGTCNLTKESSPS